jgi:hypothetical protein
MDIIIGQILMVAIFVDWVVDVSSCILYKKIRLPELAGIHNSVPDFNHLTIVIPAMVCLKLIRTDKEHRIKVNMRWIGEG